MRRKFNFGLVISAKLALLLCILLLFLVGWNSWTLCVYSSSSSPIAVAIIVISVSPPFTPPPPNNRMFCFCSMFIFVFNKTKFAFDLLFCNAFSLLPYIENSYTCTYIHVCMFVFDIHLVQAIMMLFNTDLLSLSMVMFVVVVVTR